MRPLGTPQASPHAFAVPSATKAVWMPPAIIEDPDAAAAEEGGGLMIEGILISLIPGSSLYDAYQNWKKSEYGSFVFNGLTGIWDVATMGAVSKGKALVKSGGRAIYGMLDSTLKGLKGLVEEGVQLASGKLDDGGKMLFAAYVPKSLKNADDGVIELAKARNKLRQNVRRYRYEGEAHHILPVEKWNTETARKLRQWGIDLNGNDNGVWLPKADFKGRRATIHKMHTQEYARLVEERLMHATNAADARAILRNIKAQLLRGQINL